MVTLPACVCVVILGVTSCFVIVREYIKFKDESIRMRSDYLAGQKELLKRQVNQTIEFIQYSRSTIETRLKASIKARVEEAHAIAAHLYHEHKDKQSHAEIKKIILDALRPIRFNQGRGYYFAVGLDGVEILFADHPEFEGKNFLDWRDARGAYVIRDMIELVRRQGEGFYQYTCTKPQTPGRGYPKISFIKYFEPFNGFIGTGEYLDDVTQDIQHEVLEYIKAIQFGKDGYIFVVTYDGVTLMNRTQPEMIGHNHWELTDPNGVKVIQEERKAVDHPGGDFIHYHWRKPSTGMIAPKLSFVRGIPDWQWMVGAGIYTDEIESVLLKKQKEVYDRIIKEIFWISGIALGLFGIILAVASLAGRYLKKTYDVFLSFFKSVETERNPIDITRLRIKEWVQLAESANAMLDARNRAEKSLKETEERYRALFDRSLDCIYLHDFEGKFIDINESAVKLLGYDKDEILAFHFTDVVADDQLPQAMEETQKFIVKGRQKEPIEIKLKHKNGQTVIVEITTSIIHKYGKPYAVQGIARDITHRKQMEQAVLEERERLDAVLSAQNTGLTLIAPDMTIRWASQKIREMFPQSEPVGQKCHVFYESIQRICDHCPTRTAFENGKASESERFNAVSGRWIRIFSLPMKDPQGNIVHVLEAITDITERKKMESERAQFKEQLIQSQRLESVGRLAGGVAHDFNNMLSVIIGYSEMALDQLGSDHPLRNDILEILASAKRSADLTRQLLAFARRQTLEIRPLDLNQTIMGFLKLLRRTLRENIHIETRLAPCLKPIHADIGQIEQVIMKLAINAQDAMPHGGTLLVETLECVLEPSHLKTDLDIMPGPYVVLKVSDTGIGMDKDTLDQIFDPFFTTKGLASGSGLGLSVIYGIMKQHHGHITVESEPGKGTVFHLFFPVKMELETPEEKQIPCSEKINGSETILLVEDDAKVREMAAKILKQHGYDVIEASNGKTAMEIASLCDEPFDLLVTDVIMPEISGKELYQALSGSRPTLKALFISGYTEDIMGQNGLLEPGIAFIQKPFSMQKLIKKIRDILDSQARPG